MQFKVAAVIFGAVLLSSSAIAQERSGALTGQEMSNGDVVWKMTAADGQRIVQVWSRSDMRQYAAWLVAKYPDVATPADCPKPPPKNDECSFIDRMAGKTSCGGN